ncbi:MAG: hypothetical protein JWN64_24 [Parcubacteria group bacterium]|nr:hypothetical protein [Parcubacteria group bacterium]
MAHTVLVVVIAFDLDRDKETNEVILGPGTKRACDEAILYARSIPYAIVLTTATRAGPEYNRVQMGELMRKYLWDKAPDLTAQFLEAKTFDTIGEVFEAAKFAYSQRYVVSKVVFIVKSWHAFRLRMVANIIFKWYKLRRPFVQTHELPASRKLIWHERIGTVENWFRLQIIKMVGYS